ncbi:peptidoglycan-binding domain-containing protein [Epibacterium ulvae]|uniref:peptidoglycan-binding domain-containing protein n=1 Tax=Epibacterium ulvae TaxID=1156985 RepID=UPI0033412F66
MLLSACAPEGPGRVPQGLGQSVRSASQKTPPGAPAGSCWDTEITPAVIETVTRQEQVTPPRVDATGQVTAPATFRTVTRQEVVRPRSEAWFETLCPADFSPDFVATLQRALAAREHFPGPLTGVLDRATQRGILAYQRSQGLDSPTLSLENARKLGLISVKR